MSIYDRLVNIVARFCADVSKAKAHKTGRRFTVKGHCPNEATREDAKDIPPMPQLGASSIGADKSTSARVFTQADVDQIITAYRRIDEVNKSIIRRMKPLDLGLKREDRLHDRLVQISDELREIRDLVRVGFHAIEPVLQVVESISDSLRVLVSDVESHDSSPSVGGCGDPQPTEGEARKGRDSR